MTTYTDKLVVVDSGVIKKVTAADTISLGGNLTVGTDLTVTGDLTVNGTTTTVNTTDLLVTDKLITLNDGGAAGSGGLTGIEIEENSSATGYFKTNADGDWTMRPAVANGNSSASSILTLDVNATKTITVAGSLTINADTTINSFGATLVDAADASAARSTLGLVIGTDVQAYDAELAAIAGLTSAADKGIQFTGSGTAATYDLTAAGKALLDDADAAAQRSTLGLVIGTDVQAYDAELAAIAGLTSAADKGIQFTGSGTAATYDLTAAGKALLDDADAAAQLITLGLSATAAEINLLDATAGSSVSLADGDAIIIGDASDSNATKKVLMSDVKGYIQAAAGGSVAADDITTGDAAVNIKTTSGEILLDSPSGVGATFTGVDLPSGILGQLMSGNNFLSGTIVSFGNSLVDGGNGTTTWALTPAENEAHSYVAGVTLTNTDMGGSYAGGLDATKTLSVHVAQGYPVNIAFLSGKEPSSAAHQGSFCYLASNNDTATGKATIDVPSTAGENIIRLGTIMSTGSNGGLYQVLWQPQFIAAL